MGSDALITYLEDHLAGAMQAVELLRAMREHFAQESLGAFAAELLTEVEADRAVLASLTERAGGSVGGMKEWAAWLAEKVSRLKLKHSSGDGLGTFEALEFLMLGIHGKRALWRALEQIAVSDVRLQGLKFNELVERAEQQHRKVEERRLVCAFDVFRETEGKGTIQYKAPTSPEQLSAKPQ
jgi:hypothetical protein